MTQQREAAYRRHVAKTLLQADPQAHVVPVENGFTDPGTPDLWVRSTRHQGVATWVELKVIARPKRAGTRVRCAHCTPQQVAWAAYEVRAGGAAWLLVRLGVAHLLLHPMYSEALLRGRYTAAQLEGRAFSRWNGKLCPKGLLLALSAVP